MAYGDIPDRRIFVNLISYKSSRSDKIQNGTTLFLDLIKIDILGNQDLINQAVED